MVYIAAEEDLFVYKVTCECYCRDSKSGKRALEAVPSCERAGISPRFSVDGLECVNEYMPLSMLTLLPMGHSSVVLRLLRTSVDQNL